MSKHKFHIGLAAVVTLVALRLCLGCHFLYEGVWKIKHRDEFSAEPFLTQAKGPLAGLFYAMVPDMYGRQRLQIKTAAKGKGEKGKKFVDCDALAIRWNDIRRQFVEYYLPPGGSGEDSQTNRTRLEQKAEATFQDFRRGAEKYLVENLPEIEAYFGALDRFEQDKERLQTAPFQQKRHWDKMQELRHEAAGWISELEGQETAYKHALQELLDVRQPKRGPAPDSFNPLTWSRVQQVNFAVTYGLTAIGLCLVLGLFTRLAALGGAAFMCSVVLTVWAWPGMYPPDPPQVGHALFINKDFIEMVALLAMAAIGTGRWGGLDYLFFRGWAAPCGCHKSGQCRND